MTTKHGWQILGTVGFGLTLTVLTGCQTNVAGMTLPSGHYLQHPPQYFPPSPAFPLTRELATMEASGAAVPAAPGAAPEGMGVGPEGVGPIAPPGGQGLPR